MLDQQTLSKAERIAKQFNALLRQHGIDIGKQWLEGDDLEAAKLGVTFCKYSQAFDITIPKASHELIDMVIDSLERAGYDVSTGDWFHLHRSGGGYAHITAWFLGKPKPRKIQSNRDTESEAAMHLKLSENGFSTINAGNGKKHLIKRGVIRFSGTTPEVLQWLRDGQPLPQV